MNLVLAVAIAFPAALFGLWFLICRRSRSTARERCSSSRPGSSRSRRSRPDAQEWLKLNPLTGLFEAYRDVLLYGQAPAVWELAYPLGAAALLLLVFVPLYRREAPHFAKVLG